MVRPVPISFAAFPANSGGSEWGLNEKARPARRSEGLDA
jgi:hypothetical protein